MKEQEDGIYRNSTEESFVSSDEIRREAALRGDIQKITYKDGVKTPPDIDLYIERSITRSEAMQELSPRSENFIEIELPTKTLVTVFGDLHFAHPETDVARFRQELEVVLNTPDSVVILVGDMLEGIFWGGAGGAEQTQTLDEQRGFLRSLFDVLKGRVLFGVSGEHDSKWAAKTGSDPYFDFTERTGAPYIRGVAEAQITVGDQVYKVVAQHRARGFSKYNKNHPTFSEARFDLQGADIYIAGHTHQKQIATESIRKFGRSDKVYHINIGTYKTGGEYGDRQGYPKQMVEELFGASFTLDDKEKKIETYYDILDAHGKFMD